MLGAGGLVSLMEAERTELEWERASSHGVSAPNASAVSFSPRLTAETPPQERAEFARQRGRVARFTFPDRQR